MKIKKYLVFILIFVLPVLTLYSNEIKNYFNENNEEFFLTNSQKEFLDTLQYKTFLYFINEINPENGLVKDRNTDESPATIAAVGFALPIWAIGVEKGWITRERAEELTLALLSFFWNSEQSENKFATGYKGFYYHFLDIKTGKREWDCELSSIDSGLLFCGIIFARQYYGGDSDNEKKIRDLSKKILDRVEWDWFTLKNSTKYPNTISLGWHKEDGFNELGWWGYTEALFLYIIAAGMDMPKAVDGYKTWLKFYQWREPYEGKSHVVFPAMFIHQYSMLYFDAKGQFDEYMKMKGIDYFENSRRATYVQRQYAIDNPNNWKGYDSLTWGLSACDGPTEKYNFNDYKFWGYAARGTSGPDSTFDDGTIAPTASGASIPFAPEICIPTLINMKNKYGSKGIWGKYGFKDAFNPTAEWYDGDYLGLDQGPIVIMIENYLSGFVWKYFMKDPIVQKGLQKLNFNKQL